MKVVIQKVKRSSVTVDNKLVNKIDKGLCILVGFTYGDSIEDVKYMVNKVINLRVFDDENHVMNKSILDVFGSILLISQFTLYADTKKGNRPSYIKALKSEEAIPLYEEFTKLLKEHVEVKTGIFGANMQVEIVNDGPTTIIIDSKNK